MCRVTRCEESLNTLLVYLHKQKHSMTVSNSAKNKEKNVDIHAKIQVPLSAMGILKRLAFHTQSVALTLTFPM